jgi:hypothetical protein
MRSRTSARPLHPQTRPREALAHSFSFSLSPLQPPRVQPPPSPPPHQSLLPALGPTAPWSGAEQARRCRRRSPPTNPPMRGAGEEPRIGSGGSKGSSGGGGDDVCIGPIRRRVFHDEQREDLHFHARIWCHGAGRQGNGAARGCGPLGSRWLVVMQEGGGSGWPSRRSVVQAVVGGLGKGVVQAAALSSRRPTSLFHNAAFFFSVSTQDLTKFVASWLQQGGQINMVRPEIGDAQDKKLLPLNLDPKKTCAAAQQHRQPCRSAPPFPRVSESILPMSDESMADIPFAPMPDLPHYVLTCIGFGGRKPPLSPLILDHR